MANPHACSSVEEETFHGGIALLHDWYAQQLAILPPPHDILIDLKDVKVPLYNMERMIRKYSLVSRFCQQNVDQEQRLLEKDQPISLLDRHLEQTKRNDLQDVHLRGVNIL